MIVTITEVSQEYTKNGDEYRKVKGVTGDGKETTKSIFNQHQDKWELLKEGSTLEFQMAKKGQFWNVVDFRPAAEAITTKPKVDMGPMEESANVTQKGTHVPEKGTDYSSQDEAKFRSMAMSYAKDLASTGTIKLEPAELNKWANYFYVYITGKV